MNIARGFVLCAALASLALSGGTALAGPSTAAHEFSGVWRNPKDTVHLQLRPCGPLICGDVVWASDEARAAAKRVSKTELLGAQLLRDFQRDDDGQARGKVFVPDLGVTFKGSARHRDIDTIRVKGCLLGNLICKSQVWTRVPEAAGH